MNTIVVKALAKINLAIDVLNKREDGYHNIDMVTLPLKLHDTIEITPFPKGYRNGTFLYCDDPTIVCDESNLAYKALNLMRENGYIEGNFQMMIYKRIPVEAGLGGGSADAAAVIRALTTFSKKSKDEVAQIEKKIATQVGSDVYLCLQNYPARVQGRGEDIQKISVRDKYFVLIVKPQEGLSTKFMYDKFEEMKQTSLLSSPDIPALIESLGKGDEEGIKKNMVNVFTKPATAVLPIIRDILDDFADLGLPLTSMSGTGSACFALSKNKKILEHASLFFERKGYSCNLTELY